MTEVASLTAGHRKDSLRARCTSASARVATALIACCSASVVVAGPLTVAFIGDQGTSSNARAVLQLVADERTDLLVIGGDLGYGESPGTWGRMMDDLLGDRFPVLSVAGNHDRHDWPEYERWLEDRIDAVDGLECTGAVGVKAYCTYGGLSVVQTAPDVDKVSQAGPKDDYAGFIDSVFDDDPAQWRICSFHKNMKDMQVGGKGDSTGWGVYQACRRAGAMVATGHEHSYSRTYLMDDFEELSVVHRESRLVLEEGRSFSFVSGLGGRAVRDQELDGDWWASIYAEQQGADHGALFCRFDDDTAACEFKSVSGAVPDRFTLTSRVGSASAAGGAAGSTGDASASLLADGTQSVQLPVTDTSADASTTMSATAGSASNTGNEFFGLPVSDAPANRSGSGGGGGGSTGVALLVTLAGACLRRSRLRLV